MINKENLTLLASQSNFYNIIELMLENSELKTLLPDIYLLKFYKQSKKWHPEGNVLQHTIASLKTVKSNNYLVNLSILFHDIGKPLAYKLRDGNKHTYYNHERLGINYFKHYIAKELDLNDNEIEIISYCIKEHMRYHLIPKMKNRKVKNLLNHKYHSILKEVSYADTYSRGDDIADTMWEEIVEKIKLIKEE